MKEMTIEEWGNAIFSKIFTVLYIKYDEGTTIVLDTLTGITYSVTFDGEKQKLVLEEVNNE